MGRPIYLSTEASSPRTQSPLSPHKKYLTALSGLWPHVNRCLFLLTTINRLDPSVKITYHPREKKVTQGGFYQKSSTYSFTQRITVVNTKSTGINNLKIVDHIPVSQDDRIQVKLINPKLTEHKGSRAVVEVLNGVKGQWDGADDDKVDETILGKDGKLNWVLTLPPLKSVNLVLQYEVSHQEGIVVDGLL